jgi:hypothetical protein
MIQVVGLVVALRFRALELVLGAPDQEKLLSTEMSRLLGRSAQICNKNQVSG